MAKLLKTDGTQTCIEPKNGTDFTLKELQNYVGGYIEIVRLRDNKILVVNEEGLINNLPFNELATFVSILDCNMTSIVGDAVYCESNQVK